MLQYLSAGVFCLLTCTLSAQPTVRLLPLAEQFNAPTDIVADPRTDGQLYIVEKEGRVQALDTIGGTKTLWLDLSESVDDRSEGGLLGMAFHPEPDSAYVYVNYTQPSQLSRHLVTTVARFSLGVDGSPNPASQQILLAIEQPATNHNAGDLAFGPDGYLYIPTGDGGGGGDPFDNGQDPSSLLGKILRVDVDKQGVDPTTSEPRKYAVPTDNPFVGSEDTLAEIWSLGLRNPWRISFDRQTGDLWIGDVGQNEREEVDFQAAGSTGGQNYGWNCREGFSTYSGSTDRYCGDTEKTFNAPELDYPHRGNDGVNGASITGGFVYRGPAANLQGYYIFADFAAPRLFFYRADLAEEDRLTVRSDLPLQSTSTFGEGRDGKLFVAHFRSGTIYLITGDGTTPTTAPARTTTLAVYPNPAREHLRIDVPTDFTDRLRVVLYAADGREVMSQLYPAGSQQIELSLPNLVPGAYTIELTAGKRRGTARLTVQH
ncbi:hypothetical protein LEM8419_01240 [Neolewinella maritima]|uniref:T9SS type A sorting domain-containing protein n=1 Tax=Neolewinella maritima TaxID=1383882 RepID=A0ABN8F0L9_9BACT|nr:PQQ-dependent sugar dehydrogenase [Neolewinella maritima]CAH1000062.1 hypothetical protein LEM8419_01240 [Neolewinella maritima]